MGKFYEIIGMDNLNKDGLRDDILRYETIDDYGTKHDKFVIQLNIIQLWIMKIRLSALVWDMTEKKNGLK